MIVLEKCQLRRQRGRRNETLDYYAATGWRARRNGVLLRAAGDGGGVSPESG